MTDWVPGGESGQGARIQSQWDDGHPAPWGETLWAAAALLAALLAWGVVWALVGA